MAVSLLGASVALAAGSSYADNDKPTVVFTIGPAEIDESSSLVVSTAHPGLVYTANDSGVVATVYVLDADTGALVGRTVLAGVDPVDVEALATGGDSSLVVADIGDNGSDHASITIYRISQPGHGSAEVGARRVSLTYPDGPRDAESALYDTSSGRVFVVSKVYAGARVYRTPPDVFSRHHAVLRPIAEAPALATDATFLSGGDHVVVRSYLTATVYTYPGWHRVKVLPLPLERQGESVAAPAGGREIWVGSEGPHSRVLAVRLPDLSPPDPASAQPTTGSATTASHPTAVDRGPFKQAAFIVATVAVSLLAVVAVATVVAYRRHRSRRA